MGDALRDGNLRPAFVIYHRYRLRRQERLRYFLSLLAKGVDAMDFTRDEVLELDREKDAAKDWDKSWPADKSAQKDLWRRQLKDLVLAMKLEDHKKETGLTEVLNKRFLNQLRQLDQGHSEDALQLYMNAYTRLHDPHTQYLSPQRAENFNINMSLSLEGIGAVLQADDEYTKVVSLVPSGPADRAGQLKPGDRIVAVSRDEDGPMEDVTGMRLDDVVKRIRGPRGTRVRLKVIPADVSSGKDNLYTIVREKVRLEEQSARKNILDLETESGKLRVGVISIPTFYIDFAAAIANKPDYKSTTRDVQQLLLELKAAKIDALIVDLRGNSGGSVQEANQLVGLFIPVGPTVMVKHSSGRTEIERDRDPRTQYRGPMAVLINRLSASSSEIFTGAMQDYKRAVIVGDQSFGKGTVQKIKMLKHGQLTFTIAKFFRISGQSPQYQGVLPDIEYPSLFSATDIGEKNLQYSLPGATGADSVTPLPVADLSPLHPTLAAVLPQLRQHHERRVANNPDFVYLRKMQEYQKKYGDRTLVSLNKKKRMAELARLQEERLVIENWYREARGEKPWPDFNAFSEHNSGRIAERREKQDSEEDPFLVETGEILADWIRQANAGPDQVAVR